MDHKAWPWKKKSMEKTIVESNGISSNVEIEKLVGDKIDLENRLKSLNDKLTSVGAENNKHETEAQEAIVGWEKAKAESASLKKKLEEALNEKNQSNERSSNTDAGLKECMQQLRFVREEQERRMHDALSKASQEYERKLIVIKTELADTGQRLAEAEGENTQLSKALLANNKTVEDLNRVRDRVEADFNSLVSSLESKEKENTSLRYEVRVLEKELELRNEEREFSRRTTEASHKLHLENVKKVAKLEAECQRLRILVRKRLPGPAAMSKMRNEVDMLGRRRVNGSPNNPMIDAEKINNLTEQICLLEEENKTLRDALNKKVNELQFSRNMYSRTASKLLEFESHFEESSKGTNIEPSRSSNVSHEVSVASVSEFDNDDKVSCADSWASGLLSELDNFKNKNQMGSSLVRTPKASEMKLMDDFAEMEKLAMVTSTIDNRPGSSLICSSDSISATGPVETESNENLSEVTKTPETDYSLNPSASSPNIKSASVSKLSQSLHIILNAIMEYKGIAQRNSDEILEDIRKALSSVNHSGSSVLNHQDLVNLSQIATQVSSKQTKTLIVEDTPDMECDVSKSIRKIIEITEGVSLKDERHVSHRESEGLPGYTARVLQWKTSELSSVLQRFLHTCYDLLDRKTDMKKFAEELSSLMEWMVNHCFSLQDVSSMREEIKKQFEWDESRSGSEVDIGIFGQVSEAEKFKTEDVSFLDPKYQDQSIEDKPGNHKLSNKMVEEAEDKTTSASANELNLDEKQNRRTELEITAASEKLAECQETILNLGKQLKALTSSKETALLSDELMPDLTDKSNNVAGAQAAQETKQEKRLTSQRSSLLDQMKAEDHDTGESKNQKPQTTDKNGKGGGSVYNETIEALEQILLSDKSKGIKTNCFAVVPQKKSGGVKSLWSKLLGEKKKGKSKKLPNPFAT
ncbi:filament-like plant protein 7-like [Arabis alpina]|uniref:Filament-like plant protein 7-like n=1 Tax=Arabis alpina TaxID=50452 RepID=A0A087GS97_ARAAL|nr:filament-like plant protein 7-like [Arabis alpina]